MACSGVLADVWGWRVPVVADDEAAPSANGSLKTGPAESRVSGLFKVTSTLRSDVFLTYSPRSSSPSSPGSWEIHAQLLPLAIPRFPSLSFNASSALKVNTG